MSFRQLYISKASKVNILNANINIQKNDGVEIQVPIEDVSIILFEDPHTVLTVRFITECSKNFITIFVCDEFHVPVSIITSYNNHYRLLNNMYRQINLKQDLKEKLWKEIIICKITNQMLAIKYTSNIEKDLLLLNEYINSVEDNDLTNREGIAAKVFFKSLYGSEFIRFYNDAVNACLNYGYKVITSAIIKELVVYGVDTKIGLWHDSKSNNYNLAYDLLELFRPIIDYYAYYHMDELTHPLLFKTRKDLINILNYKMEIEGKNYTIQYAISEVVKSFLQVLEGKSNKIKIPKIIQTSFLVYE